MGTMPRHRLLAPRLRVLITCFPGSLWKDERHQERMEYAKARLGYYRRRDTPAFYAALFLLTSSAELWKLAALWQWTLQTRILWTRRCSA